MSKWSFKVSVNTVELKRAELFSSSNINNDSSHLDDQSQYTYCSYTPIINHAYSIHAPSDSSVPQSKNDSKDQESIQSCTTPVPGYQMEK